MRINLSSIHVEDQQHALTFYTEVLGFVKKADVPLGENAKGENVAWLTVVSPDDPDGTELVLEPSDHPAVGPYKAALVADGIPFTSFAVANVRSEYDRLLSSGVRFTQPPTVYDSVTIAVFDDTCGNLIQIVSE
jgi:predicted enzyme related to lactoylglutathione lyase